MILAITDIQTILKDRPSRDKLSAGVEYMKKLRRHLYGEKLDDHLSVIEGYEKPHVRNLRAKYAKSNKDLFSRLGRPIDKVFSAKGGSIYLNLAEAQQRKAAALSQSIGGHMSVRDWMQHVWRAHMLDDPFGLVFMEILPGAQAIQARQQGRSFVYPTYKPVSSIHEIGVTHGRVDWVIFETTREERSSFGLDPELTYFRVVDDAADRIIRWDSVTETAYEVQDLYLPNYFGQVPAMLNSDIVDPAKDGYVLSFYDEVVELAEQYLLKGSIKSVHDFLHGFPKYVEFADDCNTCAGTGTFNAKPCESCGGSGRRAMLKVSDVKLLAWPNQGDPVIRPGEAGAYISPDRTFHEIATADLSALESAMHHTLWGTQPAIRTSGMAQGGDAPRTATEILDDLKPQADRLALISEMAERRHKFILDAVIRLNLNLPSYAGASVNYGRRFLLESPDAVWEKYSKARRDGAPQSVLDGLLNEYYETNHQADPIGLMIAKKLMYVEPFVHYTVAQVQGLNPGDEEYKAKLYYSEWLAQVSEAELIASDVPALKQSLISFSSGKQVNRPAALPAA